MLSLRYIALRALFDVFIAEIRVYQLALYEPYNAVKSLNSMADEYLKGKEIELSEEAAEEF